MNFGATAKSVLATVAPLLGTAIGGPFGGLAGTLLAKALGTTDPKAMEAAITSTDPDILLKLKQADNDFQAQIKSLEISEEKLSFDDTASARLREMSVRDTTPRNLAYIYTVGFFTVLAGQFAIVLLRLHLDPTALRLIDTTTGVLFAMLLGTKEYYFGSSATSAMKTATIDKLASK